VGKEEVHYGEAEYEHQDRDENCDTELTDAA
jgi:hypothetical protein